MNIAEGWKCAADVEKFIERNSHYSRANFIGMMLEEGGIFKLNQEKDFLAAYNHCPPVKSIIGKRAKAFNSGTSEVIRKSTKKKATGSYAQIVRRLIGESPNALQTGEQWKSQLNTYVDIFGYCPILRVRPEGMPDEISALWNIPPWLFDLDYTYKLWNQNTVEGIYKDYFIFWNGERTRIKKEDVFFIFDDGIGTESDTNLTIPDSRLKGHDAVVSNIIAAYKSRNTLITKRGAIGILSNETKDGDSGSAPLRPQAKTELQDEFKRYGLVGQAYQVIISDANLKWQQMGLPTKDLMLFEEIQDNINRLCEIYGYPVGLMAQQKQSTFSNKQTDRRDFIENTIMPESKSRDEQLSRGLFGEAEPDLMICTDFSKLTVLQEDKKLAADAHSAEATACEKSYLKGVMTKNEWRERMGLERVTDDPTFDEYYDAEAAADAQANRTININSARNAGQQQNAA